VSTANQAAVMRLTEGVWFARDMINTPASDLGPEEISSAAKTLAERHGAAFTEIVGEDLLQQNFPMVHAVGRASPRAPRLVDVRWKPKNASDDLPKVTLVGKGIAFDTGGLDLKPAAAMLLMKKDMGGSATAIALAHMIMAAELPVALRLLIATAENSVSGNAFRPGDVLKSRLGPTVEVGNTDAEGRLVLADALALADEEAPDYLMSFATLTGAARVALGPDLPAFFSTDDAFADRVLTAGASVADPVWRMPLWKNYDRRLKSTVADMNNISDGPFAGAITAALFLKRFVSNARAFAHIDLYGWRPSPTPLGPKGGEPGSARAVFEALCEELRVL
ncbi:MAG: leucyl aminopeptidase family protein, partial [Pseudomonadota bacterium]